MKTFLTFLLTLILTNFVFAQENGGPYTPDENTVLLMHFDGNANNSAAVGNDGVAHGSGVSYESGGVHGQCLRIDNSAFDKQSWIEVPYFEGLNASSNGLAVECWFKIHSWGETASGTRFLFRKDGANWSADYEIILWPEVNEGRHGQVNMDCEDEETRNWGADAPIADILELNTWYYIVMYYNPNFKHEYVTEEGEQRQASSVYCLIRDENFEEIFASRGHTESPPTNSEGLFRIGFGGSGDSYFDGWIDELRISNSYRKYRDDVLANVDTNAFPDSVFIPLKDSWTVYQWPLAEYYPYNPDKGDIERANACGPTMLTRGIHYWEYPRFPKGVIEHDWAGLDWYANYDETEYRWDQMPPVFSGDATEEVWGPAATLSAQVGVASRKTYDNMYCMPKFLKENFLFSKKTRIVFEEEYTKEEWENIIRNELSNGRICMVGGWGHYYIINGYNSKNQFFTDYSFNDVYWNDIKDFDYGAMQDMIIYFEPDWGNKELELEYPKTGDLLQKGSELEIKWSSQNISNFIIEYSFDAGYNWKTIAEDVNASDGNYKWTIPADLTDNYKIRISDTEDLNVYRKTGKFSVFNQKQFSFTYPNQNSMLAGGLNPIYWESEGILAFKLEYSFDGQNWTTMSDSINNKNHFEFDFPDESKENVLLRATDLSDKNLTFQSEQFSLFKDPNNIFQHPVDENTVLLMHFEDNLANAANNELNAIEGMPIGYYGNNFNLNLGKTFRFVNDDASPIDHNVRIYNSNNLDLGNNWSIETWVNITSAGDYKTGYFPIIIEKAESFGIFIYQDYVGNDLNGFNSFVNFSNGSNIEFFQRQKLSLNKWYHVAMISDASSRTVKFFVHDENRNLIYEDSKSFPAGSNGEIKQNENIINIGGWSAYSNRQFDGWMDELLITKTSHLSEYKPIKIPIVQTTNFSSVSYSSATINGSISSNGGTEITRHGFYWSSTNTEPNSEDQVVIISTTTDNFNTTLESLSPETTYYYRTFATNSIGTALGEVKQFTTSKAVVQPVILTNEATNIYHEVAVIHGEITSNGGAEITECGFYWSSTNSNPDSKNGFVEISENMTTFSVELKNLTPGKVYYYRSYATNSAGTTLGEVKQFTTINTVSEINSVSPNEFIIYPNPITGNSVLSFQIKTFEKVDISVFDLQGRKICTIVHQNLNTGKHTIPFGNQIISNGIYLCKLSTLEGVSTLKLVVNK